MDRAAFAPLWRKSNRDHKNVDVAHAPLIWINETLRLPGPYASKLIQIAGIAMCRIRLPLPRALLLIALAAAPWSNGQAAGSFQTKAAFSNAMNANYASPPPAVSVPHANIPPIDIGCGRGRIRDSQTHGCRGPADLR